MTSRKQRAVILGVFIAAIFAPLGWLAARRNVSPSPAVIVQSNDQRLHDMALSDLKETRDEIAKMKAHGIGMHPTSSQ